MNAYLNIVGSGMPGSAPLLRPIKQTKNDTELVNNLMVFANMPSKMKTSSFVYVYIIHVVKQLYFTIMVKINAL